MSEASSAKRLLRELKERGYEGCYSVVTDFLRDARPLRVQPFERRFETAAGKQAQVDSAQFRVEFTDEPGVVRILWLFTIILGHSRWLDFHQGARLSCRNFDAEYMAAADQTPEEHEHLAKQEPSIHGPRDIGE